MPDDYDIVGWEDYDGNRYDGTPDNVSDAWGLLVYVPDNDFVGRGNEHFWAFVPATYENWDDWYDYIDQLIEMYGSAFG